MPPMNDRRGWISYGLAGLVGCFAVADLMPLGAILGSGGLWRHPVLDVAQTLTGHLAFQEPGWHWPLLLAPSLMWPHGTSVAMTDSAPLISLIGKVLSQLRGEPQNLLGVWLALCWLLQPLAAVYALRGLGCRFWEAALAAALITPFYPALLTRIVHVPLCGHFLLLIALGQSVRMLRRVRLPSLADWSGPLLLLIAAVLVHPYLFAYAAAVLGAPVLRVLLQRPRQVGWTIGAYVFVAIVPAGLYLLLSGTAGNAGGSYGFYSMNLISPFWPQRSGLFGAALPIIDATGGQYEGFNYLGAGVLLLLAAAIVVLALRRDLQWRPWLPLLVVLVLLTLHAISQVVYVGHTRVVYLGWRPWNLVFGFLQSSGRAFWPVGYALILGALACLARRLPPVGLRALLVVAVLLQWVDTMPPRAEAQAMLAGKTAQAIPPPIPAGTTLLTTLPMCLAAGPAQSNADVLQLAAVRQGARLGFTRMSRNPSRLECDIGLSDGLETPLQAQEVRVFLSPKATSQLHPDALGTEARCLFRDGMTMCAKGLALDSGSLPSGPPVAAIPLPAAIDTGPALAPLLGFGWQTAKEGAPTAPGPWATLLFRLPPDARAAPITVTLQVRPIPSAGSRRPRELSAGLDAMPTQTVPLIGQGLTEVVLRGAVPKGRDNLVRVTMQFRGMGLLLQSVEVRQAPTE